MLSAIAMTNNDPIMVNFALVIFPKLIMKARQVMIAEVAPKLYRVS